MVRGRVCRWSGSFSCQEAESCSHQGEDGSDDDGGDGGDDGSVGSFSCQEAESCSHQGEVDQNMSTIHDILSPQWSSIQAPRRINDIIK